MTLIATILPDEVEVTDPSELVFRQITDAMIDNDQISSLAFGPQGSDQRKPSFSRSSIVTAQESRTWHNSGNANSRSRGVWACSVEEVTNASSRVVDDSRVPLLLGEISAPGHCFVDYRGLDKSEMKVLRGLLLAAALERQEIPTAA